MLEPAWAERITKINQWVAVVRKHEAERNAAKLEASKAGASTPEPPTKPDKKSLKKKTAKRRNHPSCCKMR